MIIMDISISMDILCMKKIVLGVILMMALVGATPALAVQFVWDARTEASQFTPKFTFQRTISIEYPDDGIIASDLKGKQAGKYFVSTPSTGGVEQLVNKINQNLEGSGSHVRVSDILIDYSATLVGRETGASIDYRITMIPTITDFVIREYSEGRPALLDASWRTIKVDGPVTVSDAAQDLEINLPISFLQSEFPTVYDELVGTDAEKIMSVGLIDASGTSLPLARWHSLFDPTSIISDAEKFGFKGDVVTTYSMGESRIGVEAKEKIMSTSFGQKYRMVSIEAADSATVFVPGYASPAVILGLEVVGTSPNSFEGTSDTDQGQFPIFIIYGMASIAAAGASGFFLWSSRKAKRDGSLGQSGIDPAFLRGVDTSLAAGGYHTNRGEAHLIGEESYDRTTSVYKNEDKGTMPKGWKT